MLRIRRRKKEGETGRKSQLLLQQVAVAAAVEVLQRAVLALAPVLDLALARDLAHDQVLVPVDQAAPVQVQELVPRLPNANQEVVVVVGVAAKVRPTAAVEAKVRTAKIRKRKTIKRRQLKSPSPSQEAGPHHL